MLASLPSMEILTALCSVCLSTQPQTPHLEEDLKEVLRSEAGIELIIEDDVKPEKQKRKQGVSWLCIQYQLLSCPVLLRSILDGFSHPAVDARMFLALWLLS